MSLISEAFYRLFPQSEKNYLFELKYSGRFKSFNSNICLRNGKLLVNLSKDWKSVNKEIQIGLVQTLILMIFKKNIKTTNINLYYNFLKRIDQFAPVTQSDSFLAESFNRVNEKYFFSLIDIPNLKWHDSKRKYGVYDFHTDTISISKNLKNREEQYLDYVMYHEMLHKKLKFKPGVKRTLYHSAAFRRAERQFEDSEKIERELGCSTTKRSRKPRVFVRRRKFLSFL